MAVFDCNNIKLKEGDKGSKVTTLQTYLKKWNYYTRQVDGDYGPYTTKAVKLFQSQYKLTVDGWVGSETCKKLNEVANTSDKITEGSVLSFDCPKVNLKKGSTGEAVKKLQTMLAELGYYTGRIDGDFAYYTDESLRDFQNATGHSPDGVFGPKTCPDLNTAYAEKLKKKQATTNTSKEEESEGMIPLTYKLTILPDVVLLPETTYTDDGGKTSTGGSVETDSSFDCSSISLKRGSTGENVKKLQTILKSRGYYNYSIDGVFGKYTRLAVIKLQKAQGNTPDGWFGPKTCNKLQGTSSTNNTTSASKASNVVITEFIGIPQTNADLDNLSDEVTLTVVYTEDRLKQMRQTQKTTFEIYRGTKLQRKHEGYISNITVKKEDDLPKIEITLAGYSVFLEQTIDIPEDKTAKRSELLKWLSDQANLKANINLSGLDDSEFTLKAQKSESTSSSSGSGGTMTIDEIYKIAATFKYGGQGTGTCPKKAYNLYEKGGRTFDCYDATNWLCYMLHTYAKVKCRCLQTYSPYSKSNTHRVAQIYQNGEWVCPDQAWNMISDLRPFTPPTKYGSVVVKYTLEVDDSISC